MARQRKYRIEHPQLTIGDEILTKESFEKYKADFGDDRAKGYLSAVETFNIEIAKILGPGFDGTGGGQPSYGTRVRKELIKLFDHNEEFLIAVNGKGARDILFGLTP